MSPLGADPYDQQYVPPAVDSPTQGTGMKYDSGKLRASLLRDFPLAFTEIARVLTFGANKYAARSWQDVPNAIERYTDAGDRHELELNAGKLVDEESQCLHEAQVLVNRLFVLELKLRQVQNNIAITIGE